MNAKVLLSIALAFSVLAGGLFVCMTDSENVEGADSSHNIMEFATGWNYDDTISMNVDDTLTILGTDLEWVDFTTKPSWFSWDNDALVGSGIVPSGTHVFEGTVTMLFGASDVFKFTVNAVGLSFVNPPAVDVIEGQDIVYEAKTNLASTITKESGADWLSWDGTALVGTAPSAGTYSVVLKAVSTDGPEQTATQNVTVTVFASLGFVTVAPSAGIAYSEYSYTPAVNIDSNITVSGLPTGAVYQNGTIRWVPIEDGDYSFEITATSKIGPKQTATQTVSFTIYPKLSFTTIPTADMVVVVNGSALEFYSMSTDATSVSWDFGDGTSSDEFYPVHSYNLPGDYTVTLTAYNDLGESIMTKSITVTGDVDDSSFAIEPYKLLIVLAVLVLAVFALFGKFSNRTKRGR